MAHQNNGSIAQGGTDAPVPGILAMADCFTPSSPNHALIDVAVDLLAGLGADVTVLDLRDLELPPYAPAVVMDDLPMGAHAFRQLLCAHDGYLIALSSNEGVSRPLLLNAIAWSLCPAFGAQASDAFSGKCAALMSASGQSETLNSTVSAVGATLTQLGVLVLPDVFIHPHAPASPAAALNLDDHARTRLEKQIGRFIDTIRWTQERARD